MMTEPDRPIPESYWVLPGRLLAGEYPARSEEQSGRRRLEALIEAGFDLFIDLTQPQELAPYAPALLEQAQAYGVEVSHRRFPIGDFGLPTPEQMNLILDAIDEALQAGRKVYLHCWGGIGRTGTTVGCYLVRHGRTGAQALGQLAAWWQGVPKSRYVPHSPETEAQEDFILQWSRYDHKP